MLYARSEYHTQLAKMSFDKIFDPTAGVYFNLYNFQGGLFPFGIRLFRKGEGEGLL